MSDLNAGTHESGEKRGGPNGLWGKSMLAGKRCLVVDGELLIAFDIQQELEASGAEAVCAGSLAEAMDALRGPRFDLALLDLRLGPGGATSIPLAERLTAESIPFVFLTGARSDAAEIAGFAVPVVEKPFLQPQLMAAVRKALGG